MDHNPLFDRMWEGGLNLFGNPYKLDDYMKEEKFETEVFESLRGDYKTTVTCKFNREGYLVSHHVECEDIAQDREIMAQMRDALRDALEREDYEEASEYQRRINKLRELTELKRKPTL